MKSGSLCGLEEVLSCMQRIEFDDEQLSKYRGMCWTEFVSHVEKKNRGDGTSSSSNSSNSSPATSPEPPPRPASPPPVVSPRRRLRGALVRAQSERCFERRLTGARSMWRGLDRTLPIKPSPLVTTLSEKDLLVSPGSTTSRAECKRREAVWDLFQSECAFLYDHLMVLKNVSTSYNYQYITYRQTNRMVGINWAKIVEYKLNIWAMDQNSWYSDITRSELYPGCGSNS